MGYSPLSIKVKHPRHITLRILHPTMSSGLENGSHLVQPVHSSCPKSDTSTKLRMAMANTSRKRALHPRLVPQSQVVGDSDLQRELSAINRNEIVEPLSNANGTALKSQQHKVLAWDILLTGFQLYALSANSLSLLIPTINSTINILFTIALHLHRSFVKTTPPRVPIVTSRIESAGRMLAAFIMITTATVCAAISCQDTLRGQKSVPTPIPTLIMSGIFVVKLCVSFYASPKPEYLQTIALSKIHPRNDLSIHGLGILMSIGGLKIRWWIDPLGAIVLCGFISWTWVWILIHELKLLVGASADAKTHNSIREIALAHDDRVLNVDSVRAYHAGSRMIVEVDVVMSPCQTLRVSRDVAKGLQTKLERCSLVERAFVHVAYRTRGDDLGKSESIK